MKAKNILWGGVCLAVVCMAPALSAQNCVSGPNQAVECFVANGVRTKLLTQQSGMSLSQFEAYGVSVSKIVQSQPTALTLVGLASAVADAMPPTNADGSADQAAQSAAMNAIVEAGIANGFLTLPANTNAQDLEWFSLDLVNAMNASNGIVLSPGTLLRVIDSYVVSATSSGTVNWTQANSGIATMMTTLGSAGMLKLPATITTTQATAFAQALAQIAYTYTSATGRTSL
ncbi:MAG: hypothetical protein WA192_11890 [Candidatus Acidiferrales bacterium]